MKRSKPGMPDRRYRVLVHQVDGRDEGLEVLGFGGPDPASRLVPRVSVVFRLNFTGECR